MTTPLELLVSSWHPFAAGVQNELVRVFVSGGAQVDGVDGDGSPLTMALRFGYTGAAETLVEVGAAHETCSTPPASVFSAMCSVAASRIDGRQEYPTSTCSFCRRRCTCP